MECPLSRGIRVSQMRCLDAAAQEASVRARAEFACFAPRLQEIDKLHSLHDVTRPRSTSRGSDLEAKKKSNLENSNTEEQIGRTVRFHNAKLVLHTTYSVLYVLVRHHNRKPVAARALGSESKPTYVLIFPPLILPARDLQGFKSG